MPPLSGSLTREEAAELLQLTPPMLDALLERGQLLCHYRGGELRIPIAQLETYLRDSLVRLYRFEARLDVDVALPASAPMPAPAPVIEPQPPAPGPALPDVVAAAPAPPPEPPPVQHAAAPEPELEPEGESAEAAAASSVPQIVIEPEVPAPVQYDDTRTSPRYVPRRQITGIFHDVRFTIVQLSASGLRIRHNDPLLPGDEAKLTFALHNPPRSFVMRARVVWTSAARYGGGSDATFSISGLRITEHAERMTKAVELLLSAHDLEPDRRQHPRPGFASDEAMAPASVSDDEIALVLKATQRFAADPLEATRWYGRGKFALSDEQVRRTAPQRPREREEALAVWEFLERQVELEKVSSILAWTRKSRPRAAATSSVAT